MAMPPLVINPDVQTRIREIKALADQRPIPLEIFLALEKTGTIPVGTYDDFTMKIPMGFTVIYTHETQRRGLLKHLSMSIDLKGRVPHPEVVRVVLKQFGFISSLEECTTWFENCGDGQQAINVLEPIDGDWAPFKLGK